MTIDTTPEETDPIVGFVGGAATRTPIDRTTLTPESLVEYYHPDLLPEGSDPADKASITTLEAFELVWEPKGFKLL